MHCATRPPAGCQPLAQRLELVGAGRRRGRRRPRARGCGGREVVVDGGEAGLRGEGGRGGGAGHRQAAPGSRRGGGGGGGGGPRAGPFPHLLLRLPAPPAPPPRRARVRCCVTHLHQRRGPRHLDPRRRHGPPPGGGRPAPPRPSRRRPGLVSGRSPASREVAELGDAIAVEGAGGILLPGEGADADVSLLAVHGDADLRHPRLGLPPLVVHRLTFGDPEDELPASWSWFGGRHVHDARIPVGVRFNESVRRFHPGRHPHGVTGASAGPDLGARPGRAAQTEEEEVNRSPRRARGPGGVSGRPPGGPRPAGGVQGGRPGAGCRTPGGHRTGRRA